jgi:hypothetical protein
MTLYSNINAAANAIAAPWFALLGGLPVPVQVFVTAIPVSFFALLVFRFASDQDGIRHAKDRIKAYLLELWLYKDDPGVLLRAQARVVWHSLTYLGYSLVPMAVMLVPIALLLAQIESRFAWRSLAVGEGVIVTVSVEPSLYPVGATPVATGESRLAPLPPAQMLPQAPSVLLDGSGLVVETAPLRLPDRGQVLWRVSAAAPGEHTARIRLGDVTVERRVVAAADGPLGPSVYRAGDWRGLGYPAEPPMPADSAIVGVDLDYPRARGEFLGLSSASWLLFGATLLLGFVLRGFLGVTF